MLIGDVGEGRARRSTCCHSITSGWTSQGNRAAILPLEAAVQPSSFGTDALGRVYVATGTGNLYRLGVTAAGSTSRS
jgi:hypothetical protein